MVAGAKTRAVDANGRNLVLARRQIERVDERENLGTGPMKR